MKMCHHGDMHHFMVKLQTCLVACDRGSKYVNINTYSELCITIFDSHHTLWLVGHLFEDDSLHVTYCDINWKEKLAWNQQKKNIYEGEGRFFPAKVKIAPANSRWRALTQYQMTWKLPYPLNNFREKTKLPTNLFSVFEFFREQFHPKHSKTAAKENSFVLF